MSLRIARRETKKEQNMVIQNLISIGLLDENLDFQVMDEEKKTGPIEEILVEIRIDKRNQVES